jgi:DNA-binding NarL/FixJ family response regulator
MYQASGPEIIICDDHPIVGEALRLQLQDEFGASVHLTQCFRDARMLAATIGRLDLWILDLNLPGEDPAVNVAAVRADWPDTPIVLFSGTEDAGLLRLAADCRPDAFLSKSFAPELILAALRKVLTGERHCLVPAPVPMPAANHSSSRRSEVRLTDRQVSVLRCLAEGQTNKEIARTLDISPATVKVHLAQIFGLLGVANRTEAVMKAIKLELLP